MKLVEENSGKRPRAVVMAGGEGSRLRPLTCNIPKPMMSVFDRPVMEYSLDLLKKHGIDEVAVTLQYLPGVVQSYFGDGRDFGMNISYYVENTPLGTAGSVRNAREMLDRTFIVISGDALTDFDLGEAISFHRSRGALATLVLARVETPLEYGLVLTDGEGRITRFLEKPSWGEVFSDTVNTGIYILEPEVLDYVRPDAQVDFSRDVFPQFLAQGKPLFGCVLPGYWCDIGNCQQYRQVHYDILNDLVDVRMPGERRGSVIIGPSARISSGVRLEGPGYIGAGCDVAAGAAILPYSVIGQGTVIQAHASLKRAIVGKECLIGQGAEIRGAVVGKGVVARNRVQVFEGAVVGDHSILEEEVIVKPEAKVWPNKVIEARRVIRDSVVWAESIPRSIFSRRGVYGDINGDMAPEKIVSLGRAVGSLMTGGSAAVIGSDSSNLAANVGLALKIGLMAAGIRVLDTGSLFGGAFRFAVRELQAERGFYLTSDERDAALALTITDSDGINLSKSEERKIDTLVKRGEYRPIKGEMIGKTIFVPEMAPAYFSALVRGIDTDLIQRQRFRVALAADRYQAEKWIASCLDRLGCDVAHVELNEKEVLSQEDRNSLAVKTAQIGADVGIYLEESGHHVFLTTPGGQVVDDESLLAVRSLLFAGRYRQIYLPADAPVAIEEFAKRMGRLVARVPAFPGAFMQTLVKAGEWEQLRMHLDGFYLLVRTMELMAYLGKSLDGLLEGLPVYFFEKREIPISWKQKGRVIRRLAETSAHTAFEGVEGVRLWSEKGSTLVLPDEDRPVCYIYAEGFSQEIAHSLSEFCMETIRGICQEEE